MNYSFQSAQSFNHVSFMVVLRWGECIISNFPENLNVSKSTIKGLNETTQKVREVWKEIQSEQLHATDCSTKIIILFRLHSNGLSWIRRIANLSVDELFFTSQCNIECDREGFPQLETQTVIPQWRSHIEDLIFFFWLNVHHLRLLIW